MKQDKNNNNNKQNCIRKRKKNNMKEQNFQSFHTTTKYKQNEMEKNKSKNIYTSFLLHS